jgi:TatD DNase family protein
MSPEGSRGRRNEPLAVREVAGTLAGLWRMQPSECATRLYENAMAAFRLGTMTEASLVYVIGRRAYVNLTGRCGNDCAFCVRRNADGIAGYHLRQVEDQPVRRFLDVLSALSPAGFEELVFCGYGEPTLRPDALGTIARAARSAGWKTRLNTNGQAPANMDRDSLKGLLLLFDSISVSLNAPDAESYAALCRPASPSAWQDLMAFIDLVRETGAGLRLSAVRWEGVDMAAVRNLAGSLGADLLERGAG